MYVAGVNPRRPRQWPNSDDPDNVGQLLADTTDAREPAIIAAWRAGAARKTYQFRTSPSAPWQTGHVVPTRMPSGPSTGQLAERYQDQTGVFRYGLAPADVRAADAAVGRQLDQQIAAGKTAQVIESAPAAAGDAFVRLATGTAQTAGAAGRGILGGVLGIPAWAVPVALAAAGIFTVKTLAPGLWPFGGRR